MSIDNYIAGDHTKGTFGTWERQHHNIDFIVSEGITPNGKTRVANIAVNADQFPGAFVDVDGKIVSLKAKGDAKSIAGVCLTAPASVSGCTNGDVFASYIRGVRGCHVELKDLILARNGFRGVQAFGGDTYKCTGLDGVTGTGAATTAQAVLEEVIAQLKAIRIDLVTTGL